MKPILTATAIALLMTTAAQAQDTILYRGGYWSTFHLAQNTSGEPMCGVTGRWTFSGGVKGWLIMKWTNKDGLFLHIGKSSWSFATGLTDIPLAISFDTGYREGTGFSLESAGRPMIQTDVPADIVPGFLEDFADAKSMTVTFKAGNERAWIANMTGSRGAVKAFSWCIGKIATTSPVGPQASSPVNPQTTSPVNPQTTSPVGSKPSVKKDDGSI